MSAVDLNAVISGLRSFQQDAVAHVAHQFYGPGAATRSGRFLIADETGLGKSVIARGVVAHAIRALEQDDSVDRIDIVYICSNSDLADQNLKRLNVTGQRQTSMATRLSLLAAESGKLNNARPATDGAKPINLVSFTPGTSFSTSTWRQGTAKERALLVLLLDEVLQHNAAQQRGTRVLFQGAVASLDRFSTTYVEGMRASLKGPIDPGIRSAFASLAESEGLLAEFTVLRDTIAEDVVPPEIHDAVAGMISRFRRLLALASVQTLEPDLVILDEFQRFKSLLSPEEGGEAAQLADEIFSYGDAKVLLLSATPYKPFTQVDTDEEDHYEDFLATISFLCRHDIARVRSVEASLRRYRQSLVSGGDAAAAAADVRAQLTPLMTRSERPAIAAGDDFVQVRQLPVPSPTPAALDSWVALSELGAEVHSPASIEQWKSVPHFANFMDHYRLASCVETGLEGPSAGRIDRALRKIGGLTARQVANRARIESGSGPLRALAAETLDREWWKLLWMPASMPYVTPGPIFAPFSDGSVTKQVVFSAWSAAPTSIAAILSHEANRRMAGLGVRGRPSEESTDPLARLNYGPSVGHSTLALFWPHPAFLVQADQLQAARAHGGTVRADEVIDAVRAELGPGVETSQAWEAYFALPHSLDPALVDQHFAVEGAYDEAPDKADPEPSEIRRGTSQLRGVLGSVNDYVATLDGSPRRHAELPWLATFAPGNIAYRSLKSLAGDTCSDLGIWRAAFIIAEGLRSLFNRTESAELLDHLYAGRSDLHAYWQRVLAYCADGNLRAVLDEYVFQLWCESGRAPLNDDSLEAIARQVAGAIGLRPARYLAREAHAARTEISMMSRFAVRYGDASQASAESVSGAQRQSAVRAAFNSPFAPFVLASTSVGQEGIDFHWWSHAVVHWNLPSNPVDFEQREGRVNRYAGHAVRKNVAAAHWDDVLQSPDPCAWRAAFDAASQVPTEVGDFSPWWIYPGDARIQRVLVPYPLSRDIEKYDQLRSALTLYRLTLGQPRQEDMVEMLQRRGVDGENVPTIDLRPPRADSVPPLDYAAGE